MGLVIRRVTEHDIEALVQMAWLAFKPIFNSFNQIMGPEIFAAEYPDWRKTQEDAVRSFCREGEKMLSWVAEIDETLVGMVVGIFNPEAKTGEVEFLMVHPDYQNQGLGAALNDFVLEKMKESGIELVTVSTGGDISHAAARRSYEKAGYTALPLVRYYKKL